MKCAMECVIVKPQPEVHGIVSAILHKSLSIVTTCCEFSLNALIVCSQSALNYFVTFYTHTRDLSLNRGG